MGDSYAIFGKVYKEAYAPKGRLQRLPCSQVSLKQKFLASLIMVKGNNHNRETKRAMGQVVIYQGR